MKLEDYLVPQGVEILYDAFNRPYYLEKNKRVYLSKKTPYEYQIKN